MPRSKKGKGKSKKQKVEQKLTIMGPWGTTFTLPIGRLPIKIGSDKDLSATQAIYPPMVKLDVPTAVQNYSIASGALAVSKPLDLTYIPNFATRFGALFDEYCVVGAELEISVAAVVNGQGCLMASLDEKTPSVPTGAVINAPRVDIRIDPFNQPVRHKLQWIAKDYLDLQWTDIGTTSTPVYLKLWADPTTTGTLNTSVGVVSVTGTLAFCFRGYKNQ